VGDGAGGRTAWERYAWVAGILFVVALVAEIVVAVGVELSQDDSAAKIANGLHAHETRLIVIACLSVVYAVMFVIYLSALHNLLREDSDRTRSVYGKTGLSFRRSTQLAGPRLRCRHRRTGVRSSAPMSR